MQSGDRISELYRGEVFAQAARSVARRRIHWICERAQGHSVMDIGCSQGIVSTLLARQGLEVVGVDSSVAAIEYANADRAKESPAVRERLSYILGDLYETQLPEHTFNTVIMGEFLEHQARPDRAVTRAYDLLAQGGKLIVTVPFGLFVRPDHKQTFYMASLYKLIFPCFAISEVEMIGRYLCLVCKRRETVLEGEPHTIELGLVERAEREFHRREAALIESLRASRASFSYRLGTAVVQGVHRPGRNTILLPYRLLRLGIEGFRKRNKLKATPPGTN
ncbi:MAG: class I SAM-dependent methyltransferase [Dehalococcoidia bacterium]